MSRGRNVKTGLLAEKGGGPGKNDGRSSQERFFEKGGQVGKKGSKRAIVMTNKREADQKTKASGVQTKKRTRMNSQKLAGEKYIRWEKTGARDQDPII